MTADISYKDGVLTAVRVFNAPREAVFEAWVVTSKVQKWWGCKDTTRVVSEVEPKVGGAYRHVMTIGDHGDFPINGVITEFDSPALLTYTVDDPQTGEQTTVRVEFTDLGDKTEVRLTQDHLPPELSEIVRGGWTAAFDKLARLLGGQSAAAE